eukprot:TRINITY_DN9550_c0_g1_i1.p2 TRINITY_DN9550_c0_g1~~TRINITY_DN9550_c0_g1_i1.p2  ORF type:complete len:103 (-),score=23.10 TRINITY_DN9550_c0_g1_i1:495-803(-)
MGDLGSYWYGSQLTIGQARRLAPYQNATGLQVTSSVLGAMVWAIEHPNEGVVEPDEVRFISGAPLVACVRFVALAMTFLVFAFLVPFRALAPRFFASIRVYD